MYDFDEVRGAWENLLYSLRAYVIGVLRKWKHAIMDATPRSRSKWIEFEEHARRTNALIAERDGAIAEMGRATQWLAQAAATPPKPANWNAEIFEIKKRFIEKGFERGLKAAGCIEVWRTAGQLERDLSALQFQIERRDFNGWGDDDVESAADVAQRALSDLRRLLPEP